MPDQREKDSYAIKAAYEVTEKALAQVGKLLRTTDAGRYMWADRHKSSVTGLRRIVDMLRYDVPRYDGKE